MASAATVNVDGSGYVTSIEGLSVGSAVYDVDFVGYVFRHVFHETGVEQQRLPKLQLVTTALF